ncbi:MAG TPA: response regulator transcription factor [Actinocrinis sp.]|nr:response regulator transcription factor [Actinocrinis sp.]
MTIPGAESGSEAAAVIRLLIVDDHPVVRDGLTGMFASDPGFEVLGGAANGAEAVRMALALNPDVILMDLRMPDMDGVTAITELVNRGVSAHVLVLTVYDTDSYVLPAIGAGATGYLLKDAPRDELLRAVRAAARGQAVLSPSVATRLMSRFRAPEAGPGHGTGAGPGSGSAHGPGHGQAPGQGSAPAPKPSPLSQRELEVLELVAGGNTNREAARRLFISEATVKAHLLNIYAKLGVGDRAAAVAEAFNRELMTPRAPDRPAGRA